MCQPIRSDKELFGSTTSSKFHRVEPHQATFSALPTGEFDPSMTSRPSRPHSESNCDQTSSFLCLNISPLRLTIADAQSP